MGVKVKVRIILLMVAVFCCTSCGVPGCEVWTETPHSDFYLQGDAQLAFNTVSQVDQPLQDFLTAQLGGRRIYMGLYLDGGPSSDEKYKITDGQVTSASRWLSGVGLQPPFDESLYGDTISGSYYTEGDTLYFDLGLSVADETYSEITLTGECSHDDAQKAIKEVRSPKWQNNTSQRVVEMQWTVSGLRNGELFTVVCSQSIHGKSQYYTINW